MRFRARYLWGRVHGAVKATHRARPQGGRKYDEGVSFAFGRVPGFVEVLVGREDDRLDAVVRSHVCIYLCFRGRQEERFGEKSDAPDGVVLRWYAFLVASDQIYGGWGASEETNHVHRHAVPSGAYPPMSFFREVFPVPYHTDEDCVEEAEEETHAHLEGVARVHSEGFDHHGFGWLLAGVRWE
jgi:hypothetical protein